MSTAWITVMVLGLALFTQAKDTGVDLRGKESVTLSDGHAMPTVGLGTGGYVVPPFPAGRDPECWPCKGVAERATQEFLAAGGRRLDTSKIYQTLDQVGSGIQKSGVPRSEIFITAKVGCPDGPMGFNETIGVVEDTLKLLNTSYVDLLLIHFPSPGLDELKFGSYFLPCTQHASSDETCQMNKKTFNATACRQATWRGMEALVAQGRVRSLGTANFMQQHLQDILDLNSIPPAVNQVEHHPYYQTAELVRWCQERGIVFNSYAPMDAADLVQDAFGWNTTVFTDPALQQIAQKHHTTVASVVLRWNLQHGIVVNPRSLNVTHMAENIAAPHLAFTLDPHDLTVISSRPIPSCRSFPKLPLGCHGKVCPDPAHLP